MARFEFLALDAEGLSATGVVRAQDEAAARAQLARRRLAPVKLIIANDAARPERAVPGRRIGVDALALITRQLATLIRVSPVEEALRTIAAQEARPDLRAMLTATHAAVVEGQRLSEAMTRQGRAFPPLYRAMVAAGEAAGALPQILERLAGLLEREQASRAKLLTALIYPAALAGVAVVVVIALMTFVVPKVVDQFQSMGQALPWLTRVVIGLSRGLRHWGWLAAIVLVLVVIGAARALTVPALRRKCDALVLRLPVIGRLVRAQNAARLARTLAAMIAAGAPLIEGLLLTAPTVHNRALRAATEDLARAVREGGSLSAAMRRAEVFPPILVHMTASGEAGGQLETMLDSAADYLEREVGVVTSAVLSLLEPAIIILMGAVVATIVLSILLPILQIDTLALK